MRNDDVLPRTTRPKSSPWVNVFDARPMTFELSASPWPNHHLERFSAPRRSECTRTTSPGAAHAQAGADGDGLAAIIATSIEPAFVTPIGGLVDQRHHLVRAQALVQHRREHIRLTPVRQLGKNVRLSMFSFDQQFSSAASPCQHGGAFSILLRTLAAPLAVAVR